MSAPEIEHFEANLSVPTQVDVFDAAVFPSNGLDTTPPMGDSILTETFSPVFIEAQDPVRRLSRQANSHFSDKGPDEIVESYGSLKISPHGETRRARRNLSPEAIDYVMAHGRRLSRTGREFIFLGGKDIPEEDRSNDKLAKLEGTIVMTAPDGTIVTCYRNRNGLSAIKKKFDYYREMP